jgi:xanthine/CO dehydrogenase XdhC/CoxF family maturation factor
MKEIHAIVRYLASAGACAQSVLATLVTVEGSSYRRPGARLLVSDDGTRIGAVSGGCLEEDILARARQAAATGLAQLVVYDTTSENDLIWGVGLGCHGIVQVLVERLPARPAWADAVARNLKERQPSELAVTWHSEDAKALGTRFLDENVVSDRVGGAANPGIYFETVIPPPHLVIFGAGDDAQPLAHLAKDVGWLVTVADPRPAFATAERFPGADALVCAPPDELAARAAPGKDALAVVMTHRYVHDVPILRGLLALPLLYLGLLGPKKRAEKILDDLASDGLDVAADLRSRLHAPVGLDIGGDSPDEVALSIVAEIQAVLAGREGGPLRERQRPIHG